jgi:uncharacterized membrane protein
MTTARSSIDLHDREPGADPAPPSPAEPHPLARFAAAVTLLGMGLGGFIDGIVLHQVLQWHHMLTAVEEHDAFPNASVASLEANTLADGLFHLASLALVVAGGLWLWRLVHAGYRADARAVVGLLLVGWGLFNLLEGLTNHHLLGLHHVRDDVGDPRPWDVAFLAFSVLLVLAGVALRRAGREGWSAERGQ